MFIYFRRGTVKQSKTTTSKFWIVIGVQLCPTLHRPVTQTFAISKYRKTLQRLNFPKTSVFYETVIKHLKSPLQSRIFPSPFYCEICIQNPRNLQSLIRNTFLKLFHQKDIYMIWANKTKNQTNKFTDPEKIAWLMKQDIFKSLHYNFKILWEVWTKYNVFH